jgi:hypothetical protein
MYEWHALYGIKPQRGHGKRDANGAVIRWCFADPATAREFAAAATITAEPSLEISQ